VARQVGRGLLAACVVLVAAVAACARATEALAPATPAASFANDAASDARDAAPAPSSPDAPAAQVADEPSLPVAAPAITVVTAHRLLFVDGDTVTPSCPAGSRTDQIHCLLALRYAADARAAELATSLFDATGDVAGVLPAETMEGGFRGRLRLVPELPVAKRRGHLEWVVAAATDFDDFFHRLDLPDASARAVAYRWRALGFRFMRSVGRTTPSAYASQWMVAYNVDGSLNRSAAAVRELLFHEIFHLNDAAHADWSTRALRLVFDGIVARCHATTACLAPYAPTSTTVRGGTYYAFQPDNGDAVREYAAELALRYYQEQRALLRGEPPLPRFKCGPPENARAWGLLVDEFFGGVDRTAACP
jgi:hypothetical protein